MGYTKHDYQSNDILYAADLAEMDNQIYKNEQDILKLEENKQPAGNYASFEEVSQLKSDLTELNSLMGTKKRTPQLFDNEQNTLGNLYVKGDLSTIDNALCIESWIVPVEKGKRYVAYTTDKADMTHNTYYVGVYVFDHIPSVGSVALQGGWVIEASLPYVAFTTTEDGYALLCLRKQSGIDVTIEQIEFAKKHLGCEQINSGYDFEGYPYYEYVKGVFDTSEEVDAKIADNQWTGKTILWMGTSIPEGKDTALGSEGSGKTYPQMVGEILGAEVINIALGSSMIRANTRTGDYADGYADNVLRAFSATLAEKEDLIANWETYRQKFRNPTLYTTLTESLKQTCRESSYERRLLPYLNGTYPMPDLFVIDHGHNDHKYTLADGSTDISVEPTIPNIPNPISHDAYMHGTDGSFTNLANVFGCDLSELPTEFKYSLNRNCFWGAMNFICTLILSYNPRARIVFVGNLDSWQREGLTEAQEKIAHDWGFPIIKMYEKLGFGSHVIPNSKEVWGTTNDLTQKGIYCKDGTHPHSDTTGMAMDLYTSILATELKRCY